MSENKDDTLHGDQVALGTGAHEAVDGDLDKMRIPHRVDPNATGMTAPAPAPEAAPAAASTSSAATPSAPPAGQDGA